MTARQNTTLCKISFYTHDVPLNRIDAFDALSPKLEGVVTRWRYTDGLGPAAGRVSISLKARVPVQVNAGTKIDASGGSFAQHLFDGDWWVIDCIKNGVSYKIGFGRIDDLSVSWAANRGEGQVVETIEGRTYGFGLEDTIVYFNPNDPTASLMQLVSMEAISDFFAGTPDQILSRLMNTLLGATSGHPNLVNGQHEVPLGIATVAKHTWISLLSQAKLQTGLRGFAATAQLINTDDANSDQTLWALMDQWRNPMLNELFVDTNVLSDRFEPFIVLREKPFVNVTDGPTSPWFKLTSWEIDCATITGMTLSYGSHRVNHFLVMEALASQLSEDVMQLFPPDVDVTSIRQRGLRRLHENTNYGDINLGFGGGGLDDQGPTQTNFAGQEWMQLVECWNVLNHVYWSGVISLGEMRPEIRKGQKVFLMNGPPAHYSAFPADRGVRELAMSFYVEEVTHEWTDGEKPSATTALRVSQGYAEGRRIPDITAAITKLGSATTLASGITGTFDQLNVPSTPDVLKATIESKSGSEIA